jgi:hypothetical protein
MSFAEIKKSKKAPKEDYAWNYIIQEKKSYSSVIGQVKTSVKRHHRAENRLLNLMYALSKRGFPLDETIKELEGNPEEDDANASEVEEYEPFSQRVTYKPAQRPGNVPKL